MPVPNPSNTGPPSVPTIIIPSNSVTFERTPSPRRHRYKRNVSPQAFVGSYGAGSSSSACSDTGEEFVENDVHWQDSHPVIKEEGYESAQEDEGEPEENHPPNEDEHIREAEGKKPTYLSVRPLDDDGRRPVSRSHPNPPPTSHSWVNSYTRTMTYLSFDNTLTHPPFSPTRILPTHRQDLLKPFLPTQTPHTQSTSHIHPTNHHLSTPGTCSTASSIFNTLNLLIGIGFLSLPYALRCSGLLPGLVIIISTCLLTNLTGHLLGKCLALSSKLGRSLSSYGDLGEAAFGSKARKWVSVVFLTELVVTCVAFVILIEDSLGAIFPEIETGVFRGIAFAVCLGAALVKNLTYISYASLVGIVGSLNLVGVILYNGVTSTKGPGSILDPMPISTFPENPVSTSFAVGIVMAGFAGHAVLPNIYLDMKDKSRYPFVLNVSFCIALTLYLTVAVAGYLMFGQQTLQEITMNLAALPGAKKSLNLFATALICFIPIPKYALTMAPVSQTADAYLGRFLHKSQSSSKPTEATPLISDTAHRPPKPSMTQYILIRVFLVSVTALIPFILPHFDTVLGLIGSFFTVAVSVVMPAAFYAKLTKGDESMKWVWAGCWTLVGIGALAGMLATVGMGVPGARPI